MKNLIVYVFLGALLASCAKPNQPAPAIPNNCTLRSFKYTGFFSGDVPQFAKVYSSYRRNKYEMDSIVETDNKGVYLNTIIRRKFDEDGFLKIEELPDKKIIYTTSMRTLKCIRTEEWSLSNELLRTFRYEYESDYGLKSKIFVTEGDKKDTIELYYHSFNVFVARPYKITRNGGKIRYYREYDLFNNLIKESYAEYSSPDSPDSLEKQTVIYTKTFENFTYNNSIIQKYISKKDFSNLLHTKFHNEFHLGSGIYIPRLDDVNDTNCETGMVLNEQKQLKSLSMGQYSFGNISEFKYTCE